MGLNMGFKDKTIGPFFWSFVERFGQQGIQFFFSVALARLLVPDDFGIIGMISIFLLLSATVVDAGFGQALVQKKEISATDTSTVFWFSVAAGVIMTSAICLAAPWIADFFGQPILKPITRLAACQTLISSFSVVQRALLQRDLLFRLRAKITLAAVIISGLVSVGMAFFGFGVWSLALQTFIYVLVMNIGFWIFHPWRPSITFKSSSFKELYRFGSKILAAGVLDTVFVNLLSVIIGKFYPPAALGFYTRAQNLVRLASNSISGVLGQVNFPVLARIAHDREQTVRVFSKVLLFSVMLIAPAMFGLMAAAPQIIEVLLGPRWLPVVPFLVPAGIIGIAFPIQYLNQNVLMSLGRSDAFLKLEIARKAVVGIFLALTVSWGVMPMIWGQTAAALVGMSLTVACTGIFLGYGLRRQIKDFGMVLVFCSLMGMGVYAVGKTGYPLVLKLLLQVCCGGAGYGLMLILYSILAPASVFGKLVCEARNQIAVHLVSRKKKRTY
jgi:O-antigen/teichoic acid export membrane protein